MYIFPIRYVLFYAKLSHYRNEILAVRLIAVPPQTLNISFLSTLVSPLQAQPLLGWSLMRWLSQPLLRHKVPAALAALNLVFVFALELFSQVPA